MIEYTAENGRSFGVRIAGVLRDSIFQGYLIVDEAAFLARFPSHPGPTVFLVDAPAAADLSALQGRLRSAAADAGAAGTAGVAAKAESGRRRERERARRREGEKESVTMAGRERGGFMMGGIGRGEDDGG